VAVVGVSEELLFCHEVVEVYRSLVQRLYVTNLSEETLDESLVDIGVVNG